MNSLEQARALAVGETLYFARPLSFGFGAFPQYAKAVLTKNFDMEEQAGFRWMEATISDERGRGESCEFSEFDLESGALLTEEEYQIAIAEQHKAGGEYCSGDKALFYQDNENCAFVDSRGEIVVLVKDHVMRFKVECCPKCGRRFCAI